MGIHKNIGYDFFPTQNFIGREVMVYFHYNSDRMIPGKIVRHDTQKPHVTIIQLDDGRFVLDSECHYTEVNDKMVAKERKYKSIEVPLDEDTKHVVIGSISARSFLDMENYPHNIVEKDGVITEEAWKKMRKQGRDIIVIKEFIE